MTYPTCLNCRWAKWERTPTGRASRVKPGRCTYPIPVLNLPMVADEVHIHYKAIWVDDDRPCACREGIWAE